MSKANIVISNGNRKIKDCNIFNLPVGLTCKPGVKCEEYCYSKKAERTYPGVRPSRLRNLAASKLESFVSEVTLQLSKSTHQTTRIHEGGDFYSKEYVRKWYQIARNLPEHTFYAYTKRDDIFDDDLMAEKPKNLKLIYSVDGVQPDDLSRDGFSHTARLAGYDKVAIVRETAHTCPSTSKNKWKVACIKDCRLCVNDHNTVIEFARH